MRWPSLRWLMLAVGLTGLLLPALVIVLLKAFDLYLVQETERRLIGQGVVLGQAYRNAYEEASGQLLEQPRPPGRLAETYTPFSNAITDLGQVSPAFPDQLPVRKSGRDAAWHAGKKLERLLRDSRIFNLTGTRMLDAEGCVVATSGSEAGACLSALPEVEEAMAGRLGSTLRERVSDEPPPPYGGISRRGRWRVFNALPVFEAGRVIGVVLQSRTAETANEWLWKQRRDLVYAGAAVLLLAVLLFVGFARVIERPLRAMSAAAEAIAEGKKPNPALRSMSGPKEVSVLARSLSDMSDKLEQRNAYIKDFVATVSHELKSPLTSIRGAAELLSDEREQISDEQRQRFLLNIRAAAERTTRLAQRLLTLAHAENPEREVTLEPVQLDAIARGVREHYPEHVAVEVKRPGGIVQVSAEDLDCVMRNLLENGLRYRSSAPLKVVLDMTSDDRLQLSVENDGPEISAANRQRLFERFFTTERDRGGTGLGLAMIKAIAESRGGSASVESNAQRTRFLVVL